MTTLALVLKLLHLAALVAVWVLVAFMLVSARVRHRVADWIRVPRGGKWGG